MKAIIDITDDAHGDDPLALPSPMEVRGDGRLAVIEMREVELRMTSEQVISLHDALGRHLFTGRSVDPEDPHWCSGLEHEHLRAILKGMIEGKIGNREIPKPLVDEIRWEIARRRTPIETWRSQQEHVRELNDEITHLQSELAEVREELAIAKRPKRALKGV